MAASDPLFNFDPGKARRPRRRPDVAGKAPAGAAEASQGPRVWSVSLLVERIRGALAAAFPARVAVIGEISNLKRHSSGHLYFRLKDATASVDAVMFRSSAARLKFEPADGLEVVAEGRVDLYSVRGQLQLYVERISPKGTGALELAFRQLKDKLQAEGLFDPAHKKPLAVFPRAIGVVSSPTGAAIRDIRRTLSRRWPAAKVYLMPTLVQGEGAAGQIAEAVRLLDANARRLSIDTLIVARGGGSLEDLWAFNEEVVARAIRAAETPVISGVGHEVDVTIADLVADVRAATPTAAAELAVPDQAAVRELLETLSLRLGRLVRQAVRSARAELDAICRSVVFRDPTAMLRTQMQRVDELGHRLRGALRERVARARRRLEPAGDRLAALHPARLHERAGARLDRLANRLAWALGGLSKHAGDALAAVEARMAASHPRHQVRLARQKVDGVARQLEAMSYRSVLNRGYSVTRGETGEIVRSVRQLAGGEVIRTEVADGRFRSRVEPGQAALGGAKPARKAGEDGPTLFDF